MTLKFNNRCHILKISQGRGTKSDRTFGEFWRLSDIVDFKIVAPAVYHHPGASVNLKQRSTV